MREIDFLPQWYRTGKRRQVSYRAQYLAMGGIIVVMVFWNFMMMYSINISKQELKEYNRQHKQYQVACREHERLSTNLANLQEKSKVLDEVRGGLDVSAVLAELSHLFDGTVVLRQISLAGESFGPADSASKLFRRGREKTMTGDIRYKVVIRGVTVDASDMAQMISQMEDSGYFTQIYPSFSRNTEIQVKTESADARYQANEFEMNCYLANFEMTESATAKETAVKTLGR